MKILIIEDEPSLQELMFKTLVKEKYIVETASNYKEACFKITDYQYDCILLDIMLPDGNGLKLLEELKKQHRKESIIIISAKDSIEDKVYGLEQGADDYLPKPFHLAELNARIKSVMRRRWSKDGDTSIRFGNIRIETDSFRVFIADKEISLLKKEYEILFYFLNHPNHLIDKAVLAEAVWGDHIDQSDNFYFVYAQVKNLRQQLKKAGASVEIRSVYGFGYKMVSCEN
ncbi:response regulator transcription factor [Parabacteroides bouchesdurhonensis]|uniref:response regulator transcription factor n=1 Tax=Parabacteroides bouchesdurhonensis TaxID=1936995 RepID=UPI000C817D4D|nr:response regulator transcription factor [Parabacteroides bouchesdurhonensis]